MLANRRRELLQTVTGRPIGTADEVKDQGDRSCADDNAYMTLVARTRGNNELRRIDATLVRIDGGDPTFGICTDCDEEIPEKRLLAMPTATRCIGCESKNPEAPIPGVVMKTVGFAIRPGR